MGELVSRANWAEHRTDRARGALIAHASLAGGPVPETGVVEGGVRAEQPGAVLPLLLLALPMPLLGLGLRHCQPARARKRAEAEAEAVSSSFTVPLLPLSDTLLVGGGRHSPPPPLVPEHEDW